MIMAKARARSAARKLKDRWKAKNWYNILAPASFDSVTIAETLSNSPEDLINRVTEVSLQDLTNDFRKSHVVLFFKVNNVEENNAHTQFAGHSLTSDYLRRMIRRRKSKIEGVYDVKTKDGALVRVKPFATTDKRIQNSQKRVVREAMKKTITDEAGKTIMSEFIKNILDGKIGSEIYKNCKKLYPVKRIEIYKTEVVSQPTVVIEEKKPKKKEEKPEEESEEKEKKPSKKEKKEEEKKDEKETKDKPTKTEEKTKPKKTKKTTKKKEEKPKTKTKKTTSKAKKSSSKKKSTKKATKTKSKKTTTKKKSTKK
jgi:small subunit ribosomal protein S3Ae